MTRILLCAFAIALMIPAIAVQADSANGKAIMSKEFFKKSQEERDKRSQANIEKTIAGIRREASECFEKVLKKSRVKSTYLEATIKLGSCYFHGVSMAVEFQELYIGFLKSGMNTEIMSKRYLWAIEKTNTAMLELAIQLQNTRDSLLRNEQQWNE